MCNRIFHSFSCCCCYCSLSRLFLFVITCSPRKQWTLVQETRRERLNLTRISDGWGSGSDGVILDCPVERMPVWTDEEKRVMSASDDREGNDAAVDRIVDGCDHVERRYTQGHLILLPKDFFVDWISFPTHRAIKMTCPRRMNTTNKEAIDAVTRYVL